MAADKSEKMPVSCAMFVEVNKKGFCGSSAIKNLRGIGNHAVRFMEESRMPGGLWYELPPMHGSPLHQKNAGKNHHGASMPQSPANRQQPTATFEPARNPKGSAAANMTTFENI